jgi:repressor LexA
MQRLTQKQRFVLNFIESYYNSNGFSPTFDEIASYFGFGSYNSVTDYVKVLRKKGYVDYEPGRSRNIVPKRVKRTCEYEDESLAEWPSLPSIRPNDLVNPGTLGERRMYRGKRQVQAGIPLVGTIAAGQPVEAVENIESYFDWEAMGLDNSAGDKFALRVKGDSMINRGIRDGDIVIVHKQKSVNPREVAAVRIGDEATLKYVQGEKGRIWLVPDNDHMRPMAVTPGEDFEVLGVVVGLFRGKI